MLRLPAPSTIPTCTAGAKTSLAVVLLGSMMNARNGANSTVGVWARETWSAAPGFTVAEMVFVSAVLEASVPVVSPLALVGAGCVNVFPRPVAASATVFPETP